MMTRLGLVLGFAAVVGLSAWGFARGVEPTHASAAEAPAAEERADGDRSHDEALRRYRSNQSNHWRHVMVGRR